jgi:hypothetical protein
MYVVRLRWQSRLFALCCCSTYVNRQLLVPGHTRVCSNAGTAIHGAHRRYKVYGQGNMAAQQMLWTVLLVSACLVLTASAEVSSPRLVS